MYIDLNWVNLNNVNVTLEIYRGDNPLDRDNLPVSPVATIADGATTWRDTDVELGKTYYYVFKTISDTDEHISVNYPIRAINRRGVGSQDIRDGDANLGYFGTVSSGQFITANELKEKIDLTAGAVYNPFPIWHKFIRNNKILFIPQTPIVENISWNALWNADVVYGKEDSGNPFIEGGKKVVTIGADQYIVRLMTGFRDDEYETWDNNIDASNEFDDLVYPLAHSVMTKQKLNNITTNGVKWTEFFPNGNGYVLTQEAVSETLVTGRGGSKTSANDDATTDMRTYYEAKQTNYGRTASSYRWWPVLELIEVKPEPSPVVPDPDPEPLPTIPEASVVNPTVTPADLGDGTFGWAASDNGMGITPGGNSTQTTLGTSDIKAILITAEGGVTVMTDATVQEVNGLRHNGIVYPVVFSDGTYTVSMGIAINTSESFTFELIQTELTVAEEIEFNLVSDSGQYVYDSVNGSVTNGTINGVVIESAAVATADGKTTITLTMATAIDPQYVAAKANDAICFYQGQSVDPVTTLVFDLADSVNATLPGTLALQLLTE